MAQFNVIQPPCALLRRLEHLRAGVHADHLPHVRRKLAQRPPRPAAEVRHDRIARQQGKRRRQVEAHAILLAADLIPVGTDAGEELAPLTAGRQEPAEVQLILLGGGPGLGLAAGQEPQVALGGIKLIQQGAVEVVGILAAGDDPAGIGKCL